MKKNQLICADSLNYLESIPDDSIDSIITDPPYMTTDLKFDKEGFNVSEFNKLMMRKLKDNGYLISFGSIELLAQIAQDFKIRWSGVWLKNSATMRTATAKKPMSKSELYSVFCKPNVKIADLIFNKIFTYGHKPYKVKHKRTGYKRDGKDSLARANTGAWTKDGFVSESDGRRHQTDVLYGPNKTTMKHSERTEHPTQKPINIIETLIKMTTNENDLILDPFCGSGTIAVACLNSNRNYLCIEKNPLYYEIAKKRIEKWHNKKKDGDPCHKLPETINRVNRENNNQLKMF